MLVVSLTLIIVLSIKVNLLVPSVYSHIATYSNIWLFAGKSGKKIMFHHNLFEICLHFSDISIQLNLLFVIKPRSTGTSGTNVVWPMDYSSGSYDAFFVVHFRLSWLNIDFIGKCSISNIHPFIEGEYLR